VLTRKVDSAWLAVAKSLGPTKDHAPRLGTIATPAAARALRWRNCRRLRFRIFSVLLFDIDLGLRRAIVRLLVKVSDWQVLARL
jgi:hypothetical protein